jgi:uncharacterized RDD family membrane protein YckC
LIFSNFLEQLSFYARLITAILALFYFGLFNSSLINGATPGKRFLHLRVADATGNLIGLPSCLLRSSILVLPILLYGWQVPGLTTNALISLLVDIIVYGVAASILYLILFNRQAGQSLDDLLVGTRVVYEKGVVIENYPETPLVHKTGALLTLIVLPVLIWGSTQIVQRLPSIAARSKPFIPLYEALNRDPRFNSVGVSDSYQQTPGEQLVKILVITLWPRKSLDDAGRQEIAQDAALIAQQDNIMKDYSGLQVQIIAGYDLGFFQRKLIWLCAPPDKCSAEIVRNSFLRFLNFTSSFQLSN